MDWEKNWGNEAKTNHGSLNQLAWKAQWYEREREREGLYRWSSPIEFGQWESIVNWDYWGYIGCLNRVD